MSICVEIGASIVALRTERGFTQEWLALECGISTSYLRLIEHGAANPTINELELIAASLGMELRNPFQVTASVGL